MVISEQKTSIIPKIALKVYDSLKNTIPLMVVNGTLINMSNEQIPAEENLNPYVINIWPIRPMLHIIHNK